MRQVGHLLEKLTEWAHIASDFITLYMFVYNLLKAIPVQAVRVPGG